MLQGIGLEETELELGSCSLADDHRKRRDRGNTDVLREDFQETRQNNKGKWEKPADDLRLSHQSIGPDLLP